MAKLTVIVLSFGSILHCDVAAVTVTTDGPVITNSLPSGEKEVQSNASGKLIVTEDGEQEGGVIVPKGSGGWAAKVKVDVAPGVTCRLH